MAIFLPMALQVSTNPRYWLGTLLQPNKLWIPPQGR